MGMARSFGLSRTQMEASYGQVRIAGAHAALSYFLVIASGPNSHFILQEPVLD